MPSDDLQQQQARHALPDAVSLLQAGRSPAADVLDGVLCGWHDSRISREAPAFAVASDDGGLADTLIGQVLRVWRAERSVVVYCFQSSSQLVEPISLCRRAWLQLAPLSVASDVVRIEVLAA